MTNAETATYVYCVVQAARKPSVARAPSGVPGCRNLRALDAGGGLWLVVGDVPLSRYGEPSIQQSLRDLRWLSRCALSHEAVVEHWLRARALVPMKLFTIFESDERALAHLGKDRRRLERSISRVAERSEWGVRIRRSSAQVVEPPKTRAKARAKTGSGYLAEKKHARDRVKTEGKRASARARAAFATLTAGAVEADRRPPPPGGSSTTRLLLDAAFLVACSEAARFRAVARRLSRELAPEGYRVELTGPWPPYNFIEP